MKETILHGEGQYAVLYDKFYLRHEIETEETIASPKNADEYHSDTVDDFSSRWMAWKNSSQAGNNTTWPIE